MHTAHTINYYLVVGGAVLFSTLPAVLIEFCGGFIAWLRNWRGLLSFSWTLFACGLGFLIILKESRVLHLFRYLFS